MPRSLTTLLAIDARLAAAIARAERRPAPRPHQPRRHRVEGQIVAQIALPRFLVWRSYLMSRKPTKASMERAAHHLRGIVLFRYAQWADAQGKPLPTRHEVPGWALHPEPRRHERAATPIDDTGDENIKDSVEKEGMDPADLPDPTDAAADWWDEMGWDDGLTPDAWDAATPEQHAQWQQEALDSVSADLDFQAWIENTVLSDLQVLQLLESYWNGQAAMFAGQETITEMGIAGDFDLTDPYAMDFLRYQAGNFVKIGTERIDEKLRQELADALWSGWGGEADQGVGPFGIPQLAKYIQGVMNQYENDLAGMSYNRALLIANTEVARAETFGQFVSMLSSGVQEKIWVVTAGACQICVTQAEQGPVPIRDQFPNGLMAPPGHPRCFPAGTRVGGPLATGGTCRNYEGPLISLTTEDGHRVALTPNHPVWTDQGWKAARDVRIGDAVGVAPIKPEFTINDTFHMLSLTSTPHGKPTPYDVQAEDFHGDGQVGTIAWVVPGTSTPRNPEPDLYSSIVQVREYPFSGKVYNLETEEGWYTANGIVTHNCRCSLSPWVDESKPFNPNDWKYAPDPAQMQRLFQDPSFAAWPQYVANLNDSALQLVPPPPTALGGFGQLQYSDLPPALQQVIDPQAFAGNYTDAWKMMMQGIGQAVNQAANADASIKAAEQAAMYGGPGGGKVLTLDDILAGETPDDLADAAAQIRSALDNAVGGLPDLLADLGDGEGE